MSRKFDLIVFGASGFTGQFIVKVLLDGGVKDIGKPISWAIAGRSEEKLQKVLERWGYKDGVGGQKVEIIKADVNDEASLRTMAEMARIVINAVGPYRLYGEAVIKACIEASTHYVDICGEPECLEKIEYIYNSQAEKKGSLVVQSCGFDSIPADLGISFVRQQFSPPSHMTSVETFLSFNAGPEGTAIHSTTYECAVMGFGHQEELADIRKQAKGSKPELNYLVKKPSTRSNPFSDTRFPNKSCFLFPGSDASVVKRTQEHLARKKETYRAFQTRCYFTIDSGFMNSAKMMLFGGALKMLSGFSKGRDLLLKYPEMFTNGYFRREGPTERQMKDTTFSMTIFAKGCSEIPVPTPDSPSSVPVEDLEVVVRITGPEPGYIATSRMVVLAALTIIGDEGPSFPKGGVFTPGFIFGMSSSFIPSLAKQGIDFEIVAKSTSTVS